tara:strand:- start:1182 stop:1925 length:744 start_codon:yes stop_codon:yes gene_type:complete
MKKTEKTEIILKNMMIDGSTRMSTSTFDNRSTLGNLIEDFPHYLVTVLELHQTESINFKSLSLTNVSDICVSKIIYRENNLFCLDFTYTHDHNEYQIELEFLLPSFIEGDDYKEICIQLEESFEDELLISSWIQDDEILEKPSTDWSNCIEERYHESSDNWSLNDLIYELLISQEDDLERQEIDFFHCQEFLKEHVYCSIGEQKIDFYVHDFNYESLYNEHSFKLSFDNEQRNLEVIKRYFSKYLLD